MNNTKAIYFDYGGTLDCDGIPWKEQFKPIYEEMGINVTREKFDRAFYDSDDSIEAEKPHDLPFKETIQLQVSRVFKGLEIDDKNLQDKVGEKFLKNSLSKLEENRKLLERLKQKYSLGIISNFYGNLPAIIQELGFGELFDVVIDSTRVGFMKPDPQIFYEALKPLDLLPAQAVFVGDSMKRDMAGAKGVGMPHIWLRGENSNGVNLCCPEDKVINRLSDLLEFF